MKPTAARGFTLVEMLVVISIVNKYGVEKVSRANQVESLFIEQKEDSEDDDFIV